MKDLTAEILELIRRTSTDLPADIEKRLRDARDGEAPASAARKAMDTILANVEMTRRDSTPICQDTGTPLFFVKLPDGWNPRDIRNWIRAAIAEATRLTYLRPNAVDSLSGKNSGNNLGSKYFPTIHFEEIDEGDLTIDLILKGGGCENVGAQYSLPDDRLKAGRDLEGVRRVVLDAVNRAQGEGCAPGFLGIAIGGDRGTGFYCLQGRLCIQTLDDEKSRSAPGSPGRPNHRRKPTSLGIGPMGFRRKCHRFGHADHLRAPPASLLFCYRLLHVLGVPPPENDRP